MFFEPTLIRASSIWPHSLLRDSLYSWQLAARLWTAGIPAESQHRSVCRWLPASAARQGEKRAAQQAARSLMSLSFRPFRKSMLRCPKRVLISLSTSFCVSRRSASLPHPLIRLLFLVEVVIMYLSFVAVANCSLAFRCSHFTSKYPWSVTTCNYYIVLTNACCNSIPVGLAWSRWQCFRALV